MSRFILFVALFILPSLVFGNNPNDLIYDSIEPSLIQRIEEVDNISESIQEFTEALKSEEVQNDLEFQRELNIDIYILYTKVGNYKNAYDYHLEAAELLDSLSNEEKSRDLGKLEAKLAFEKKNEEARLIKEAAELKESTERERKDNLQYSGIFIVIILLFVAIVAFGRLKFPVRVVEGVIFFTFLLFFEFTLVLLDPYIESFSGGAPAYKLLFNATLAALIFPLHAFFEKYSKSKIAV